MPMYEYECSTCGTVFEKRQGFYDEPKADCPNGHSETQRLIVVPAIVFKGSGFYINDSKGDKSSANGVKKDDNSSSKLEGSAEKKSDSSSESKATESSSSSSSSSDNGKSSSKDND